MDVGYVTKKNLATLNFMIDYLEKRKFWISNKAQLFKL